jgi:putative transposase
LLTEHISLLRVAFRCVRARHPFTVEAAVILPDHLHTIWTLPEQDADLATRWRLIKSAFSHGLPRGERISASRAGKGERGVWQRRYWEHTLRDEHDFARHLDYIHLNSVKHRYAPRVQDWPSSSFRRLVTLGVHPKTGREIPIPRHAHLRNDDGFRCAQPILLACLLLFTQGYLGGSFHVPLWVVISCHAAMAIGTLIGGWRIVWTMDSRISAIRPTQGACAELGGAITIFMAIGLGTPISTTHTIAGAIAGVGVARGTSSVRWGVAARIVFAWVLTLPVCAAMGALIYAIVAMF